MLATSESRSPFLRLDPIKNKALKTKPVQPVR